MTIAKVKTNQNPGCLLQILWFAFIGIWLGQAWMVAAWICMLTIVGIPAGVWMLNRVPKVMALREPETVVRIVTRPDGKIQKVQMQPSQINILLRSVYFLLVGWWLSALWLEAAYAISLTVVGLPVGFWMFDLTPALLTLKR
ncbi:MAG: YccF domain-containing protein [Anaerolineaceae bacterium]|nr:YccF domain-containing protein [Anaerolineaceae bacterium]